MLTNKLRNRLGRFFYKIRDVKINKRIVVFESDDWGSIRMSSIESWKTLLQEGYPVDKRPYEHYDILESLDDITSLFEVLVNYKDIYGNHPCITANMLLTNPDFDRIRQNGYKDYFYETIDATYSQQENGEMVIPTMKQGIERGIFKPQFHGREHFNVEEWMEALQRKDETILKAFGHRMCGLTPKSNMQLGNQYMVSLRSKTPERQQSVLNRLEEGLSLFEQLWGYKSKSFVAPCYTWNKEIEHILALNGVELIQTSRQATLSHTGKVCFHFLGEKNNLGQVYSIRNCSFEPSIGLRTNEVSACMNEVRQAFKENRPAIISSHRINYVSGLDLSNRENNLRALDLLLKQILLEFPDVAFLSSDQMVDILSN